MMPIASVASLLFLLRFLHLVACLEDPPAPAGSCGCCYCSSSCVFHEIAHPATRDLECGNCFIVLDRLKRVRMAWEEHGVANNSSTLLRYIKQLDHGTLFLLLPLALGLLYMLLCPVVQRIRLVAQQTFYVGHNAQNQRSCPGTEELRRIVEQLSGSWIGSFGSVKLVRCRNDRRMVDLREEYGACQQKLIDFSTKRSKLSSETTDVKFGRHELKDDGMMEQITESQDRSDNIASGCLEGKYLSSNGLKELGKMDDETDVCQKVVERFWKVRGKATGPCETNEIQDKASILLQDSEDLWHYGETNEDLYAQLKQAKNNLAMVQAEFQACSASLAMLKSTIEEEICVRKRAEDAVFSHKQQMSVLTEFLGSELQQLKTLKESLKEEITSHFQREASWIHSLSDSLQDFREKVVAKGANSEIAEEDCDIVQQGSEVSRSTDVKPSFSGVALEDKEAVGQLVASGDQMQENDDKVALAQALKEKVTALLLLSQQEERHILEANANMALEAQISALKQQLTQVTREKVNALLKLARLQEECTKLHNHDKNLNQALWHPHSFTSGGWGGLWEGGATSEDEKDVITHAPDGAGKPSSLGYLKQLWPKGPELGSRSKSLSHMFSLSKSKDNETVGNARLRVENASLRESLWSIRHLCKSAYRLRLTIARIAADTHTRTSSSIRDAVEAVDGVISEALQLKVALHDYLPANDLGWNSIGFPLTEGDELAPESPHGEATEDLDIVTFFGLEIVRLVLLAAQLQKRFLGQNM